MSTSRDGAFELLRTHVLLGAKGEAKVGKIPAAYGHAQKTDGWFFGAAHIDKPARWWEIHPLGDEILFLASGEVAVTLEEGKTHRVIKLREGETCVVPCGTWHRVDAIQAGDLVFVTFQKDTRNRPI
jgi:mannose-6-phosphate isomerase-like protein (cupin superfamily)